MIIGLHGCACHPFKNWDECDASHKQKFMRTAPVKLRCSGREGTIVKVSKGNFYMVSFGNLPNQQEMCHAAQLISNSKECLNDQKSLF